jgi:hypothetical protein
LIRGASSTPGPRLVRNVLLARALARKPANMTPSLKTRGSDPITRARSPVSRSSVLGGGQINPAMAAETPDIRLGVIRGPIRVRGASRSAWWRRKRLRPARVDGGRQAASWLRGRRGASGAAAYLAPQYSMQVEQKRRFGRTFRGHASWRLHSQRCSPLALVGRTSAVFVATVVCSCVCLDAACGR